MGKSDYEKLYNARMEGMWNAYEVVKLKNLEELKNDLQKRGYFGIDTRMPQKEYDIMIQKVCETIYNNVLTCSAYTLHDKFNWGNEDIKKYKEAFENITDQSFDWNFMCEQYVSITDYANYLNSEFDLGINIDAVSQNENSFYERRKSIETRQKQFVKEIINKLKINGYGDASAFLEGTLQGE